MDTLNDTSAPLIADQLCDIALQLEALAGVAECACDSAEDEHIKGALRTIESSLDRICTDLDRLGKTTKGLRCLKDGADGKPTA